MATLKNTTVSDTGAIRLPVGTTAQRPGSPSVGQMRYNSTFKTVESYDGTRWKYTPDIIRNNLVLYLDAGEPSSYSGSGTTWTDLSGGGNNGTLTNGPTYDSANGGSIVFDGTDDYVNVPFSGTFPTGSSPRTLCAFFNLSSISGGREIFGIGQNSGAGSRTALWVDSSNKIGLEAVGTAVLTSNWSGVNNWVYLCAVLPTTTVHSTLIYVNGSVVSGGEILGSDTTVNTTNFQCVIGTVPAANTAHMFIGKISNVSLYNRALTAKEIKQNYEALRGRFGL